MFIHDIYILTASDPIEVKSSEEATVNLVLERVPPCYHTLLTGEVLFKGLPVKNATVKVFDKSFRPLFHTVTDEKGVYSFYNILNPGEYKVIATADGYKTSETKSISIRPNTVTKLSFEMMKSSVFVNGIVYGKIYDAGSRKPIENATVYIKSLGDCNKTIYTTTSNHSGQYLIYNLLPHEYKMIIKKQGYISSRPIELTIRKYDRMNLNLDLIRNSNQYKSTISGLITFDKAPISGVPVFLYLLDEQGNEKVMQVQVTNEQGLYLFSNVKKGCYLVKGKLQNGEVFERHLTIDGAFGSTK